MSLKPYPDSTSNHTVNNVNNFTIPGLMETSHRNQKFLVFPDSTCKLKVALYKRDSSPNELLISVRTKQQANTVFQEHEVCLLTSPLHVEKETVDGYDVFYLVVDIEALEWGEATWYVYADIRDGEQEYREKFGIIINADTYAAYPHIGSPNDSEFVLIRPRRS